MVVVIATLLESDVALVEDRDRSEQISPIRNRRPSTRPLDRANLHITSRHSLVSTKPVDNLTSHLAGSNLWFPDWPDDGHLKDTKVPLRVIRPNEDTLWSVGEECNSQILAVSGRSEVLPRPGHWQNR
jgi:hypothetical protein